MWHNSHNFKQLRVCFIFYRVSANAIFFGHYRCYYCPKHTSVSCHVTEDLKRVSTVLRIDPVLPVSSGASWVPDELAGPPRLIGIPTYSLKEKELKLLYEMATETLLTTLEHQSFYLCYTRNGFYFTTYQNSPFWFFMIFIYFYFF